ncbi:bcl-2 homologous antagonist/killer isoform X2 [Dasypus novemcinctus]|uniref:bcl-2 homologous antagonist/killer isoform X2 n=1 Tax=Dasypus novemcinctus TaxID=9361 RepID=UPI00265F7D9D|nr:bcl-2 homologous antagonist/killer isoform X2 [Dasypus novemcinctus]
MASEQGPGPPPQDCGKPTEPSASAGAGGRGGGCARRPRDGGCGARAQQHHGAGGAAAGHHRRRHQPALRRRVPGHAADAAAHAGECLRVLHQDRLQASSNARSLFESGINWGRVVALLGFGYRLAIHVYQRGLTGFLGQVASFVANFMLQHGIARWIAQRGGWAAALDLGNGPIRNVLLVLAVVLLGQFVVRRYFKS